jgi:hypothetical protein
VRVGLGLVTAEEITDVNTALTILKALADGANPFTGQVFPHNSVYQHPEVVRALFTAVEALERSQRRRERSKHLPERAGTPWTAEEDQRLSREFDGGKSVIELAKACRADRGGAERRHQGTT